MNPATIVALALQGIKLATSLMAEANQVKAALSSDDEAALKSALAELQAANDALYGSVQDKLAAAAQQG